MPVEQDEKLIKFITSRQSKMETDRAAFNERMQEAADYVAPHRDDILGNLQKGQKKATKIYDGTAMGAAVLAADGIHGYHVSPAFPWFKYQMNRKEVNKIPEVKQWLQEIEFNMYMALNRSNFYSEVWAYIYDGITLGTPDIYCEEDLARESISFEAVHPGENYITENRYGEIDVLHRKRKMSARQLVQKFGKGNVTEAIKDAYDKNPFAEFEVIHAVFPREEYDDRMKDAKNKRYASIWYIPAGRKIALVSGFDNFPHHVWRYMRSGKEPYAITPATLAMPNIKGLNLMAKSILGAAQMAVDPPLNVPAYLEGKVQWKPRGLNYYEPGTDKGVYPVLQTSNLPFGIEQEEAKQKDIKEAYHVDTFLMLASLEGRGQRTAYEVSELMAEKAAVLGAELGPLNRELDAILDSVYHIEVAAGRMPPPPDILLEIASQDRALRFDPVYMGPLAQAQRERFAKDGLRKFLTEVAGLVQIDQAVLDNLKTDDTFIFLADTDSVPAELLRSPDERDKVRQGRMTAMRQQDAMEELQGMAEGLQKASAADKNTGGKLSDAVAGMMGNANAA